MAIGEAGGSPRPTGRAWAGVAAQAVFFVGYPLVIYLAHSRLSARGLGLLLLTLYTGAVLVRARADLSQLSRLARQHMGLALLIGLAVVADNRTLLLLMPMLVSLYLLFTFSSSLLRGPPMIERFARIIEDDLPDFTLPYCRKLTLAWCGFLLANSIAVAVLALEAPIGWWATYSGLVFYLLMGALLGGEFVLRKLWFRHYQGGLADRLFEAVFPPERTSNGRRSLAYQARREARLHVSVGTAGAQGEASVAQAAEQQ